MKSSKACSPQSQGSGCEILQHRSNKIATSTSLVRVVIPKVSTFLNNFVTGRTNVLQRFQSLQNLGLINLVPAFADPNPARF